MDAHAEPIAPRARLDDRIGQRAHARIIVRRVIRRVSQRIVFARAIIRGAHVSTHLDQSPVQRRLREEETRHLLIERERLREERRGGVAAQLDQPMPREGRITREVRAARESFHRAAREQIERERDRRPAPRDIIVQICVEPLVAQIDVAREREHDDVHLEPLEPMLGGEPCQPRPHRRRILIEPTAVDIAERRLTRLALEQLRHVRLCQMQPAEAIVEHMTAIHARHARHRSLEQPIEPPEREKQTSERTGIEPRIAVTNLCGHDIPKCGRASLARAARHRNGPMGSIEVQWAAESDDHRGRGVLPRRTRRTRKSSACSSPCPPCPPW